jgi:D-alanyl-D-alanine carboxypeptidase
MFTTTLGRITIAAVFISTFCLGLFLIAAWSVNEALYYKPELVVSPLTASTTALSFLVFDAETGQEIFAKEPSAVLPIASITKLATAALFYKNADLTATSTITWSDVNTEGDAGKLHAYEEYSNRELMYPLLLESSNDAATAMTRVHGTLVDDMNAYVDMLGLTQTHFEDASGLSNLNVSTAGELSVLVRALRTEEPHIFDITRLTQFIGEHTGWMNNNPLVEQDGYQGGKHGFTYEANRTDVAFFDETLASGHSRLIGYVILGSENVPSDIEHLRSEVREKVQLK